MLCVEVVEGGLQETGGGFWRKNSEMVKEDGNRKFCFQGRWEIDNSISKEVFSLLHPPPPLVG